MFSGHGSREDDARTDGERRFRAVFDGARDAMLLADDEGRYVEANRAACTLLGRTREEILAARTGGFSPPELDADRVWRDFRKVGRGTGRWRIVRSDGTVRDVEYVLTADVLPGLHLSVVRDLAERAAFEAELRQERERREAERERRASQLQALADAALTIGAATSIPEITSAVTEAARRIIGAHASVTSFTQDENWVQAITARSLSEKYAAYRTYEAPPDGSGIYRIVCDTNRPLRLTQAELLAHAAFRGFGGEASRHPPLRGWLAVPLVARNGRNLGLVQLTDKYEGDFGEADEAMLVQLAQLASEAVENARLLEEVSAARGRLESLSRRLVRLQEEERRAIAQELHDEVGQLLTGLRLMVEDENPGPRRREEKKQVLNELIGRVRDLSMNLRPPMLDTLGLLPTLLWQVERFEAQTAVRVEFRYANLDRRFPAEVELTAFRIVQEALTNVARHAAVDRAQVEVWAQAGCLGARVADGGSGFDVAAALAGHSSGLAGMLERSRLLGGRLTIDSLPGAGTRLSLELPLVTQTASESGP